MSVKNQQFRDINLIGKLLQPSILSGMLVVLLSLGLVVSTVVAVHYKSSSLRHLVTIEQSRDDNVYTTYVPPPDRFSASQLVSDIPLFIFWAGVGIAAYYFIMAIAGGLRNAENFREEIDYVHTNRHAYLQTALKRLSMRVGILLVWLLYLVFTAQILVPYTAAVAYASSGADNLLLSIAYATWAVFVFAVCLHLHVIMLRLLCLRPRVFGSADIDN